jgi:hypothetical protein
MQFVGQDTCTSLVSHCSTVNTQHELGFPKLEAISLLAYHLSIQAIGGYSFKRTGDRPHLDPTLTPRRTTPQPQPCIHCLTPSRNTTHQMDSDTLFQLFLPSLASLSTSFSFALSSPSAALRLRIICHNASCFSTILAICILRTMI